MNGGLLVFAFLVILWFPNAAGVFGQAAMDTSELSSVSERFFSPMQVGRCVCTAWRRRGAQGGPACSSACTR